MLYLMFKVLTITLTTSLVSNNWALIIYCFKEASWVVVVTVSAPEIASQSWV